MEISRESWHYWVAAKWGGFESGDFCHYVRRFLLGVLALFLLSALGVLIGYALISGGFVLYKLVQTGHLLTPNGWWGLGFVIDIACLLVVAVVGALYGISKWFSYWRDGVRHQREEAIAAYISEHGEYPPPPEPGFVSKAYRSIKDKTCYRIAVR
jgi:hypothetical protein